MSEHYCKDCKNDGDNVCKFTWATHITGIECPSFGAKEKENEMEIKVGDRVRVTADENQLRNLGVTNLCVSGKTGIVKSIRNKCYKVDINIVDGVWEYYEQDLELVESDPTVTTPTARKQYGHPRFYEILKSMAELHSRKNHDYAGTSDPLKNLRSCERFELKPFMGVMVRLQDKWSRLEEFVKSGKLMVKGESVTDTLMDNAVYSILAIILYEEQEKEELDSNAAADHETGADRTAPLLGVGGH